MVTMIMVTMIMVTMIKVNILFISRERCCWAIMELCRKTKLGRMWVSQKHHHHPTVASATYHPVLQLFTFWQSLPRTLATTILRSVAVDFISIQLPGFPVTFIFVLGYFHFYIEIYRLALLSLLQQTTFTFMLMSLYFHTPIHVTSDKLTNWQFIFTFMKRSCPLTQISQYYYSEVLISQSLFITMYDKTTNRIW